VHLVTCSKGRREASFHPSVLSSIHPIMVCLFWQGGERMEYRRDIAGKVKDVVKHHFIHLSHHRSVHPSNHPSISSWSVYSDRVEKKWNTDTAWQANVLSNTHTHTCALSTRCVHPSIRPVMVYLLQRGGRRVELAPTSTPVGRSVHGMGCISSSSLNHSTFFSF